MKYDIINSCKFIARHTIFSVQAIYCGQSTPSEEVNAYEERARDLILNASDSDFEKAYDECVECGIDDVEMTSEHVLRCIGDKAETAYETLCVDSINVIKEK